MFKDEEFLEVFSIVAESLREMTVELRRIREGIDQLVKDWHKPVLSLVLVPGTPVHK